MKRIFLLWLLALTCQAQVQPAEDPTALLARLWPDQAESLSEEQAENLYQLYQQPLDLNAAGEEQLASLFLLTPAQIRSFLRYRKEAGPLVSLYELQAVPDLDLPLIRKLLPFVRVEETALRKKAANMLLLRYDRIVEQRKGFIPDAQGYRRYPGWPFRLYARLTSQAAENRSFNVTVKQDAGEALVWNAATRRYGPDFVSASAHWKNRGRWMALQAGDYQLSVGQGLILAGGFALGKGAETVLTVRRPHLGIRSYTSGTESGFFRGGTATYRVSNGIDATLFISRIRRDANQTDSTAVSSLQTSGLHRTTGEVADKGALLSIDIGGHIRWKSERLQAGVTFLHTRYDKALRKADRPYNRFEFSGRENSVWGVNLAGYQRNVYLFGEAAVSSSGGTGIVAGALAPLNRRWDASLLFRRYGQRFHSFYGNAFGENTRNSNETGLYAGATFKPTARWQLSFYADGFRFPWLKYLVDTPSQGYGGLFRAAYLLRKNQSATFQAFFERKEKNLPATIGKGVVPTRRGGCFADIEWSLSRHISLHTRVAGSLSGYKGYPVSAGLVCLQDVSARLHRVTLSARVAWLRTDDYDSRIYSYEKDVAGAFSIPAYAGKGWRGYLLVQVPAGRRADAWLRLSRTEWPGQASSGSGLDEIASFHRTDIRAQLRLRW